MCPERLALASIERYPDDKYSYATYAEVGIALLRLDGTADAIDAALARMEAAASEILDPVIEEDLSRFMRMRRRLETSGVAGDGATGDST
jgi:hypothetical protein